MQRVLIVGCGDTGCRVARYWVSQGAEVGGLVRTSESVARVRSAGAQPIVADLDGVAATDFPADLIYYFAPPPRQGDDDLRLGNLLAGLVQAPERLVYISTSGVYGDCAGAWVDETRPLNPQTPRALRRAAAERRLAGWQGPWVILRAPGIYGPQRLPIDKVRAGEPVLCDADCGWSNRIHVDDLANAAVLAATQGPERAIYNVADGQPTKMAAYYGELAQLLGVPPPRQIDWATAQREFGALRLSFLAESRRLDNRRMLTQLGVRLRYPVLRDGLAASLTATD